MKSYKIKHWKYKTGSQINGLLKWTDGSQKEKHKHPLLSLGIVTLFNVYCT